MFASGFHRLTFFFSIAAVAASFYAINEWWGILAAVLLCVPTAIVIVLLPGMLIGTVRQAGRGADAWLTWVWIIGGVAFGVFVVLAYDSAMAAILALVGASFAVSGIGLLYMRIQATRYRAMAGQATADELSFLEDLGRNR